jgi:hypothetical protein
VEPLVDVGQCLERDDVLAVEREDVGEGRLGGRQIAQVEVTPTEHDAGGDVIRMVQQAGLEQLEGPRYVTILPVDFGERGEGEPVGIFGVPALEFLDLA